MHDIPHGRGHIHIHTQPWRKAQDFSSPPVSSAPSKTPNHPICAEPDVRPPLPAFDVQPHKLVRIVRSALRRGELRFEPAFWIGGRAIYDRREARKAVEKFKRELFDRGGKVTYAPRAVSGIPHNS